MALLQQQAINFKRRENENLKRKNMDDDTATTTQDEQQQPPPAKRRKTSHPESFHTLKYMVQEDVQQHYMLLDDVNDVQQQDLDDATIIKMDMIPTLYTNDDKISKSTFSTFPASILSYIFLYLNQITVLHQIAPVCKH